MENTNLPTPPHPTKKTKTGRWHANIWCRSLHLEPFKIMAKVKPVGHIWGLEFNWCVSWQPDHFWLRYSKFHIWPWKIKVKVMVKVKSKSHIWGLEFNKYVCFSFRGKRTMFGRDTANTIFDLENQGQGHNENWPKSKQAIYRSRAITPAQNDRNPKICLEVIAWTKVCSWRQHTNRYKNIKSPLVYQDD